MPSPAKNKAYRKAKEPKRQLPAVDPQPGFVIAEQRSKATKFCCCSCGKLYSAPNDNFIKSSSPLYYGWDGYVPMCKSCADLYLQKKVLPAFDNDERKAMERMCSLFDWYWDETIFEQARKARDENMMRGGKNNLISCYSMKRQMRQNILKGQTYLDSTEQYFIEGKEVLQRLQEAETAAEEAAALAAERAASGITEDDAVDEDMDLEEEGAAPEEDIYFFGPGYTIDQYKYLRDQYDDWCERYDTQTKAQEEIFKSICIAQLNVQRAQAEGDIKRTTDAMKTLQELMDSARIKPKQKAGDTLVEQNTFGTLIQQWENEQPIPEPREEWRDVDGIGKAITVWFYGHLSKMFHLDNDSAELYEQEVAKYTVEPPRYVADEESEDDAFREKFNAMRGKKILKSDGEPDE